MLRKEEILNERKYSPFNVKVRTTYKLCSSLFVTCVCQDVDRFVVEVCKAASGIRKILKS